MWPCLQILVVTRKSLELCLKSWAQNCEKVPVKKTLRQLNRAYNFRGVFELFVSIFLGCRKWGCNKWGFKEPFGRNRHFFRPFFAFLPFSGGCEEHPGNTESGGKRPFFRYPWIGLKNPHLLNPQLRHSHFRFGITNFSGQLRSAEVPP